MKKILLFAAMLPGLFACSKTEPVEEGSIAFKKGETVTLAVSADRTKVSGTDNGTGISFLWEEGDKVLVKVGADSAEFTIKTGAGTATATFEGTMPAGGNTFDMRYPTTIPDLSSQDYVSPNQIPHDKMLFTASGCTLDSTAELEPQYSVLQLGLNGQHYTDTHYFKEITATFSVKESEEYTQKYVNKLNIPDSTVVVPYAMSEEYVALYLVVYPGTYHLEVNTVVWDGNVHPKQLSTSSDVTFTAGECLKMDDKIISSCLAAGTKITMADGSTKKVEDIVEGDLIRTFDHEAGQFSSAKVCLALQEEGQLKPLTLHFASGNALTIAGQHGLLEKSSRKYFLIHTGNVAQYVGKSFYNAQSGAWDKLLNYEIGSTPVDRYAIYSANHLNVIAENMLTVEDDVDFLLNIYELDDNLKADPVQLAADIEKYGLWKLSEECPEYVDFAQLMDDLQCEYLKIALGKGLITNAELDEMRAFWDNL